MKSVFGYLNPINVVGILKNRVKSQDIDQEKLYETINFDFCHEDYMPSFDKCVNQVQEDDNYEMGNLKLDEVEEIYLAHYDILKDVKQAESRFVYYEVKSSDTIYGLELKFQIRFVQKYFFYFTHHFSVKGPHCHWSGNCFYLFFNIFIYKKKLRLPWSDRLVQLIEETELDVEDAVGKSFLGRNLMDEIMLNKQTRKYSVCYMANVGNIQGTLTINEDIILFDPTFNDSNRNLSPIGTQNYFYKNFQEGQILKYQACVCFKDIQQADFIQLPFRISNVGSCYFKDYIVQIVLKGVGKKYRSPDRIKKPIGAIYFKIFQDSDQQDWDWQEKQCQDICDQINDLLKLKLASEEYINIDEDDDDEITFVPFFDTTYNDKEITNSILFERSNMLYGGSAYFPKMQDKSAILEYDQFIQVICNIPSVFRSGNWRLIYNNHKNGSSLNTLLQRSECMSPQILIIKDFDGYCYGAYLSDFLRMNHGTFYGTGETFLFTFKKNNPNITIFNWSNENQYFIYCDQDGFGVGCGDKYGIYMYADLIKGYTSKCETFRNEVLGQQENFEVDWIELWSIDLN